MSTNTANQNEGRHTTRILLAEDDLTLRALLATMLRKWDYEVVEATNGEEALAVMSVSNPPRIALLDWSMPIIDGLELCQILRKRVERRNWQSLYIIMLSQHDSPASVAAAMNAGANDFIKKPAEPLELRSRLDAGKRLLEHEDSLLFKGQESRLGCMTAMCTLAESRDYAGTGHMRRVAQYAELISRAGDNPAEFSDAVKLFAPLHDIGKICVPDRILNQPEKLSPADFAIVQEHAVVGYRMLQEIPGMGVAAEICHTHHERWNGDGYPRRLANTDIPLSGRIVALADVYDVLRSRRQYKPPFPHDKAVRIIRAESDEHFDPVLVEVFLDMEQAVLDIAAEAEITGGDYHIAL